MVKGGVISVSGAVCTSMVVLCIMSEHGAFSVMSPDTDQRSTPSGNRAHVDTGEENNKQQQYQGGFGENSRYGIVGMM